jgi:hypothetical protein
MRRRRGDGRRKRLPESPSRRRDRKIPRFARNDRQASLLDRWWMQVLVAGWVLFVVVTYIWLQVARMLAVAQRR